MLNQLKNEKIFWFFILLISIIFVFRSLYSELTQWHGFLADDAYISLRHAWNFFQGYGFNYNQNERVEGYTNFLYTAIMSIPFFFKLSPEIWIKVIGILSGIVLIIGTAVLGRSVIGATAGLILAVGLALDNRFPVMATWGLETIFYTALHTLGFVFLFQRRILVASIAFALAAMTRMEAVLLFGTAALYVGILNITERLNAGNSLKQVIGKAFAQASFFAAPFLVVFGTYYALRWSYYGFPFPNTYYAKVGNPIDSYERGLQFLKLSFSHMNLDLIVPAAVVAFFILASACLAVMVLDPKRLLRAVDESVLQKGTIVGACGLYFFYIISVGGDHHGFSERFLYHFIPLLLIGLVVTFSGAFAATKMLIQAIMAKRKPEQRQIPKGEAATIGNDGFEESVSPVHAVWQPRLGLVTTVLAVLIVFALDTSKCPVTSRSHEGVIGWASLGVYLKNVASKDDLIAVTPAGAIPYYSQLKTIDMHGLADVHIAHRQVANMGKGAAAHEKKDMDYVLSKEPRYIGVWLPQNGRRPRFPGYRLEALVRMDGKVMDPARVLKIDPNTTKEELAALRRGKGSVPGKYKFALLEKITD